LFLLYIAVYDLGVPEFQISCISPWMLVEGEDFEFLRVPSQSELQALDTEITYK
jgi:hypothetical protein